MKTVFLVYLALVFVALSSCKNSSGSNNQATVPMNGDCLNNPASCQSGLYQQSAGFYPYTTYGGAYYGNYYTNSAAYLCNCPAGTVPTYNNYAGLGCVSTSQVYGYGSGYGYGGGYGGAYGYGGGAYFGAYAYFGYGPQNNQWVNIPQISNNVGYGSSSCYNGVIQSCLTDQPSTCSVGFTCRSNTAGSRIGLCVSNNSSQYGGQFVR